MENNTLRLSVFIAVLLVMAIAEAVFEKKQRQQRREKRWLANFGLMASNIVMLKLLGPITAIVVADYAMDNNWGLLALSPLPLPFYVEIVVGILLLDMAIYFQHVCSHKIPIIWRLHKVHHADRDIDVTTGFRFHPIEIALSMLYKCMIVLILGPVVLAVVIFEILLNASAMFNHANVRLPKRVDGILRLLIVTPDFHRVHHSEIPAETDNNYGFFLSFWDRMFGTYTAQPSKGHAGMIIGLKEYQHAKPASLWWCLKLPFSFYK